MDIVLCKNNHVYWVLFNPSSESLALYNFHLYPMMPLNDYSFNENLECLSDSIYTIERVMRSNTIWYTMNRMREYEEVIKSESYDRSLLFNNKKWKWIWKRDSEETHEAITTEQIENMIYEGKEADLTKEDVYTGRQIKEEIQKLVDAPYVLQQGRISMGDIKYFKEHYIDSEFSLSDFKYYVLYYGKFNIVAKKVELDEKGEVIWLQKNKS